MRRLAGKVAFVTGAARGQGRAHVLALAREGADIIALDVCEDAVGVTYPGPTEDDLREVAEQVEALDRRVLARKVDVRDLSATQALVGEGVETFGRLDVVVANAGIGLSPWRAEEITEEVWDNMISVNLSGAWRTCKAAIPHLRAGGRGGSVILISSVGGLKPYANSAHYVASKYGLVGLMKTLALELGPESIRVNSIHPTQVDTPMIMNEDLYRLFAPHLDNPTRDDFEQIARQVNTMPVAWVQPEDVSDAVVFLASDESRFITGATLPVDAGSLLK